MYASMFVSWNNQNMQLAASDTPRKKYIRSNICVICGLSFIQTEITPKINECKSSGKWCIIWGKTSNGPFISSR